MTTIYTFNNKVLKNSANDKWLTKKAAPAGFVMNASNVVATSGTAAYWEGPNYPDAWQGVGKTVILTVSQDITTPYSSFRICYATRTDGQEEQAGLTDYISVTDNTLHAGIYTYTGENNWGMSYNYGKYICISGINTSDVSKITIQILDP